MWLQIGEYPSAACWPLRRDTAGEIAQITAIPSVPPLRILVELWRAGDHLVIGVEQIGQLRHGRLSELREHFVRATEHETLALAQPCLVVTLPPAIYRHRRRSGRN